MGCGKSVNKEAIKKGEVSQPQIVEHSKVQKEEGSGKKYLNEKSNQNSGQKDQIALLNNQFDKSSNTNYSSYYPNGQPNLSFGKADKFQSQNNRHLYFFGVNQINEQQILKFDIENQQFENLYSNLPQQQKESITLYNYTLCLQIDEDNIFICGGINQELTEIQNDVFIFNSKTLQFTKQPNLVTSRYTHFGLIHKKKVYCFGGRSYGDDEQAILRSCEVFDLQKGAWDFHPPLNIARCTAMTFLFNQNDIYVAGGYSGPDKRTKKIEKFNTITNQWDILDFKLHRGLEGSFGLASKVFNEFIIFGGYCQGGATSSITSIDIQEKSVRFKGKMIRQRVLHKGVQQGDNLYIFGGDESYQIEKINLNTFTSIKFPSKNNFTDFCDQFEIEKYSAAIQTQEVDYYQIQDPNKNKDLNVQTPPQIENSQIQKESKLVYHLLGTDDQPFIIEFSGTDEQDIVVKSLPTNLELSCYQGGCRINSNEIFLAGGISFSMNQVLSKCFLYDYSKKQITKLEDMIHQRYAFSCVFMKDSNEIFVIGGRSYSNLDQEDNFSLGEPSQDDPQKILLKLQQNDSQIGQNKLRNGESLQNSVITNKNQQGTKNNSQLINNKSNLMQNKNESQLYENTSQLPINQCDVLVQCEKLDLKTKKWTSIAQLKRPRSSASSFVYINKIYVYGGYHGSDIYKNLSMESYDIKNNRWEEHSIKIDPIITSLEASQIIVRPDNQNKFLIFGGQIDQKSSSSIWELDILNLQQQEISQMKQSRYLHKIVNIKNEQNQNEGKVFILGGNKDSLIECYSPNNSKESQSEDQQAIGYISNILQNTIGDNLMKRYLLL